MSAVRFRDVTILHDRDGSPWNQYLIRTFQRPNCDVSIHSINVSELAYQNLPEIEASVRESYGLILLVTADFLGYMENNKEWFGGMLTKRDSNITTIVAATLCVDRAEFIDVCVANNYYNFEWEMMEINPDGQNAQDVVMTILERVDTNRDRHKQLLVTESDQQHNTSISSLDSSVCQIFPSKINMTQDKIAIVFADDVQGEITLLFDEDNEQPVSTMPLNPYCVSFIPPILPPGRHKVHVFLDGREIDVRNVLYSNNDVTSLDLMRQFFGLTTVEELDRLLSTQYSDSVCTDDTLKRLVNLAAAQQQEMATDSIYPTALHWAAANGLKELTCQMMMSPCAVEICQSPNRHGKTVSDLARHGGHHELQEYIEEFIETKGWADVCDLYVQASSEENNYKAMEPIKSPNDYKAMRFIKSRSTEDEPRPLSEETEVSSSPEDDGNETYEIMSSEPPSLVDKPPPLPHRSRVYSVPETDMDLKSAANSLPTAHEFLQMKTVPKLKDGAVGCRSQNELIDIMEEVKSGNFTIGEAEMLFNAWKDRYQRGNFATSFKDKQATIGTLLPTTEEGNIDETLPVSEPLITRKVDVGSRYRRNEQGSPNASPRGSDNSVTMRTSGDSGCDVDSSYALDNNTSEHRKSLVCQFRKSILTSSSGDANTKGPPLPPRDSRKKKTPVVYTKKPNNK